METALFVTNLVLAMVTGALAVVTVWMASSTRRLANETATMAAATKAMAEATNALAEIETARRTSELTAKVLISRYYNLGVVLKNVGQGLASTVSADLVDLAQRSLVSKPIEAIRGGEEATANGWTPVEDWGVRPEKSSHLKVRVRWTNEDGSSMESGWSEIHD